MLVVKSLEEIKQKKSSWQPIKGRLNQSAFTLASASNPASVPMGKIGTRCLSKFHRSSHFIEILGNLFHLLLLL